MMLNPYAKKQKEVVPPPHVKPPPVDDHVLWSNSCANNTTVTKRNPTVRSASSGTSTLHGSQGTFHQNLLC